MGPTFEDLGRGVKRGEVIPTLLVGSLLLLVLLSAGVILAVMSSYLGPECIEWEETGGMTCIAVGEGVTNCMPNKRCVRYAKE
jgi:hypothetical protein